MDNKWKIPALIIGGYLLGRTKKLGLALALAGAVGGTTAFSNRSQLLKTLGEFTESSPELKSLQEKITGRLADSGKDAARSIAAKGVDQLSQKLQDQTDKMKSTLDSAAEGSESDSSDESDEPEDSTAEADAPEEAEDSSEEGQEPESGEAEEPEEESQEEPAEDEAPEDEEEPAEESEGEPEEPEGEAEEEEPQEEPAEDEEKPAEKEKKAPAKKASATKDSSSSDSQTSTMRKGEARAIREWAQENDVEVSSRGRISNDVVEAYREATKRRSR